MYLRKKILTDYCVYHFRLKMCYRTIQSARSRDKNGYFHCDNVNVLCLVHNKTNINTVQFQSYYLYDNQPV